MYTNHQELKLEGAYKSPSLIRKKVNANYFFVSGNSLFKNNKNTIIRKFDESILLCYANSSFLVVTENGINHLYHINSNSFIECEFRNSIVIENHFESKYIAILELDINENFCGVYDVERKSFLFKKYNFLLNIKIVNNDFIFGEKDNEVYRFTTNGDFYWTFNLNQLRSEQKWKQTGSDEFLRFLGIANDFLFILTKANRIVVLNAIDGSYIRIIYSEDFPKMTDAFLNQADNHIYCLASSFVSIDAEKLEIKIVKRVNTNVQDPNDNSTLYGIKCASSQGDYISFSSFTRKKSGFAKWIGMYSYKDGEILWHHELLPSNDQISLPAFESPQLVGENLFVVDTDNTLHMMTKG